MQSRTSGTRDGHPGGLPPESPDFGLFGPQSVTWRVHADPMMLPAGLRALLLQALHPLAMAGVAEHSRYREDPWGRLIRTARYIGAVTYGSTEQAEEALARVRAVHLKVRGTDPESGARYRADDPALLTWVHCCETDSFLRVTRAGGLRLTAEEADRYVAEQRETAWRLGVPRTDPLPATEHELAEYFERIRPELRASAAAREATRFVLLPPMPLWVSLATPARPAWTGVMALGMASLPRWARRMYGLPGWPVGDLGARVASRSLRASLLALPPAVREGPHLKEARARVAAQARYPWGRP
ncbi:oxygenase MpaB family protein [Streptacidiphilus carbonis]|jgi:uncharacterized protein (DUF2236 family)|uniref:oxygenase MpaB family protein n=1 Tax=Streptacidiphilus carbonis TaxID=105422 RepID=UPI0005A82D81|nr:oxygenase MpaB family protein [Streptacidiphilus carbonis]